MEVTEEVVEIEPPSPRKKKKKLPPINTNMAEMSDSERTPVASASSPRKKSASRAGQFNIYNTFI